ncbi:MAG: cell division protein FtsX, partial [Candidatus Zixiibacteriota bacterium]
KRLGQDFLSDHETNPLPRSILLSFEKGFASAENFEALALSLAGWRGVFQVSYSRAWLRRTEGQLARIDQALRVVMIAVLGGAMLNAALLAGLIVRAKADYIKQMRLLGAGGVFLGAPHVLQGALLTGLAGALSWGIIMAAQRHFQISEVNAGLPPYENMAALALTAAVVGAFGAALAVRVTIRRSR